MVVFIHIPATNQQRARLAPEGPESESLIEAPGGELRSPKSGTESPAQAGGLPHYAARQTSVT